MKSNGVQDDLLYKHEYYFTHYLFNVKQKVSSLEKNDFSF